MSGALKLGDKATVSYFQEISFPDSTFDVVVVSEVLEHLTSEVMRQGLCDIRRVLKPNGRMIGTVPSREDPKDQTVICPCCGKRFHRWRHEQSFGAMTMRDLLSKGFEGITVIERTILPWRVLNWKGKLLAAAKWLLWRLGSHGSNENVFFEAAKPGADRNVM